MQQHRITSAPIKSQTPRAILLLLIVAVLPFWAVPGAGAQRAGGRYYPETGLTMAAEFVSYFDRYGGLALFGYPITPAQEENGLLVQYFERERFEYHPEYRGTAAEVLLGLLGSELTEGRADGPFKPVGPDQFIEAGRTLVPETNHTIGGPFLNYWRNNGGLAIFGYPISEEFVEDGLRQQWFERARFEYHPELPPDFLVTLGHLGREALALQEVALTRINVADGPAIVRHMKVDLAQGGESRDPRFMQNVIPQIQALGVELIGVDNIYTHYDVVSRAADGTLSYDWSKLDAFVDDILATGAKPFFNLSYMPPALSGTSDHSQPPLKYEEWQDLVRATAHHYKVERGLSLPYWEVWNEPNLWDAWKGSFLDYLHMYDLSRRAVRGIDPEAEVGGPALSSFDDTALDWLAGSQTWADDGGYLSFLSWHAFGFSPAELRSQVERAHAVVAKRPGWNPELLVTALNVRTGGAGDTSELHRSDTSEGAAQILAALNALEQAGVDRTMIFEAKDGVREGQEFWGRWGILTANGLRKPSYHALQAYQSLTPNLLPVGVEGCEGCGMIASPTARGATLIFWNTSYDPLRVQITLPPSLAALDYTVSVLDAEHNNPRDGDPDALVPSETRNGAGLVFAVEPTSVMILQGE